MQNEGEIQQIHGVARMRRGEIEDPRKTQKGKGSYNLSPIQKRRLL